jgi:hypothetical protein
MSRSHTSSAWRLRGGSGTALLLVFFYKLLADSLPLEHFTGQKVLPLQVSRHTLHDTASVFIGQLSM